MSEEFSSYPTPTAIMEMSEGIDLIAKALPKAQAAMGEVFKNANNPAFKTKYADLAAVIEAVLPALNANGISLLQPAGFDGERVKVGTMLLHESGQWVRCAISFPLAKRDAHGIGSAITYGRRYGLQAMSGVAQMEDDGNAAAGKTPLADAPAKQLPEPKRAEAKPPSLAERADRLEAKIKAVSSVTDLDKVFTLAAALCAELSVDDPKRLREIEDLRTEREEEFAARIAA